MQLNEPVAITMTASQWLLLAGWINAHRSTSDWDPAFIPQTLEAINGSLSNAQNPR